MHNWMESYDKMIIISHTYTNHHVVIKLPLLWYSNHANLVQNNFSHAHNTEQNGSKKNTIERIAYNITYNRLKHNYALKLKIYMNCGIIAVVMGKILNIMG